MTNAATAEQRLEVVGIPVADVDRAKAFYANLGWRLDADFAGPGWSVVQFTPPGSPCSIHFGIGVTTAPPGSAKNLYLIVDDIVASCAALEAKGVKVEGPFNFGGLIRGPRVPGTDPERRSYRSLAAFSDPDGNGWILQELRERLPGRGLGRDLATTTALLKETAQQHGTYEPTAAKHDWWDFYAAYMVARENGKTPDDAKTAAIAHVDTTKG